MEYIYNVDYSLFDGGVYDNPDVSIHVALRDINQITEGKTGTLATYLPEVESYLAEKKVFMEKETVKEQEQEESQSLQRLRSWKLILEREN